MKVRTNYKVRELPALVKAGCREAAGRLVQEIKLFTSTTPSARAGKLRDFFLIAQPPLLG